MDDCSNVVGGKSEGLCRVCGDKASGKHYGVASCDGCRGFFKRSIRRNLEYVCKENGRCIVDVTRRNQCQACRFKKCLHVNMKRDAVQHERAPRSTQASLHHYPLGFAGRFRGFPNLPLHHSTPLLESHPAGMTASAGHYLGHQSYLYHAGMLTNFANKPTLIPSGFNLASSHLYKPQSILSQRAKDDEVTSSEEPSSTLCNKEKSDDGDNNDSKKSFELPLINTMTSNRPAALEIPCLSLFPAENIYESAAKLLFLAIKWARSIPSFLQLSFRDQSILLEESWSELFVLTAAQWAFPVDESTYKKITKIQLHLKCLYKAVLVGNAIAPTSRHCALEEDARKLRDVITRLSLLRVDHTEYACLKALVLFKAECRGLCESTHVELLQDQTHVMLHEYCNQRQNNNKGRFGKLLLTLPGIQSVSRRGLEELIFRQTVGDVAIDRLLTDLSKITH